MRLDSTGAPTNRLEMPMKVIPMDENSVINIADYVRCARVLIKCCCGRRI